jgi:hypothetical protein
MEGSNVTCQSGQPVSWQRTEPGTSKMEAVSRHQLDRKGVSDLCVWVRLHAKSVENQGTYHLSTILRHHLPEIQMTHTRSNRRFEKFIEYMEHRLITDSRISLFYLDSEDKWNTKPATGI